MKNVLKNLFWYGTGTLLCIVLVICFTFGMGKNNELPVFMTGSLIIEFACVIFIWIQIIVMLIDAIKNKKFKEACLIYFLNMFYIPFYYSKKNNKSKKLPITVLIINILLYIISLILVINIPLTLTNNEKIYTIEDYNVQVSSKDNWIEKNPDNFNLKLCLNGSYALVWCYDEGKIGNESALDIFNDNINQIENLRQDFKLIEDKGKIEKNNEIIYSKVYTGIHNGDVNYYYFNMIEWPNDKNMFVYVLFTSVEENYNNHKEHFDELLDSIKLIE